ncbi:MAG TPA: TadE/TadG family type IV pilus assembly protein [Candidatus Limnocylindrales bacterium]|nr:TadE/TadG family type IV pilus assembly protein [Candidatus Limnocylindrales bacterium]
MNPGRTPILPSNRRPSAGQSVAEFAIILPVILLLLIGIADLGRLYTSVVAVESAAREAADFGAFDADYWDSANLTTVTLPEMEERACTAAMGSHLQDYESPVTDGTTCTNPAMTCMLERNGASTECASSGGFTNGVDCSDPTIDPPCTVHVRMDYQFHLILAIPPFPSTIAISRDSYFRISDLEPLPSPTP